MDCDQARQELSARLDGEDDPSQRAAVDAHLQRCPGCRTWFDDAAAVTRLARIGLPVPATGVPDTVLDAAPGPGRARLATGLRLTLGLLGAAQLLLAVAQTVPGKAAHVSGHVDGASGTHLLHESAAWNLAVGIGFLLIAWRRSRPAGVLPLLSAFVAALLVLSAGDLFSAAVGWDRIASHLILAVGYLIVVALSLPALAGDPPPGTSGRRTGKELADESWTASWVRRRTTGSAGHRRDAA
jgi:predicted anti-sigma-YlaC factor YlaD